jgi:deoxyribodipyrimidine photolyase-related protein
MRHFGIEMDALGFKVNYLKLNDPNNKDSYASEILDLIGKKGIDRIIVTESSSHDEMESIKQWQGIIGLDVEIRKNDLFMCDKKEFEEWATGRKELRLEFFYRMLRRKYDVLMDGDQPEGGAWNFDKNNRKPLTKKTSIPKNYSCTADKETENVINLVNNQFTEHFGSTDDFIFGVTRYEALKALNQFIEERLIYFGDYQDAMNAEDPWLFHSHLSMYLNNGLLKPKECIELAEKAFHESKAPINSVEGFIRQILGWREYVRGLYWLKMPNYRALNELTAEVPLPSFYWNTRTKMNCLKISIKNTKDNAYSHHIQRLMILGNFALIAGIRPKEVNDWFLSVYADAYEWVELPNVSGMALFADGGIMASKPYASSGAYINRMSNYCKGCHYDVKEKVGKNACPFNYLYWNFLDRNRKKLSSNPRLGLAYRNLNNMPDSQLGLINESAQNFLSAILNREEI